MKVVILVGSAMVLALVLAIIGSLIARKKAKNKSIRSLPKGADDSDFTQEFIRRYHTDD